MYKYYLGLKYLLSRKINLLGVIGVTIGVWALVVVISIFSGFIREIRSHIRGATSDLSLVAAIGPSYAAAERVILQDQNVAGCAPKLIAYGLLLPKEPAARHAARFNVADPDTTRGNIVFLAGIDPARESTTAEFGSWLDLGRDDRDLEVEDRDKPFDCSRERLRRGSTSENSVPLEARLADPTLLISTERFYVHGRLRPGSAARLFVLPESPRDVGVDKMEDIPAIKGKDFNIAGAFKTPHSTFDRQYVFAHIDAVRELMGYSPKSEPYVDVYNEISIRLKDYAEARATKDRLRTALVRLDPDYDRFPLVTWEERNETFLGAVDNERSLMKLVLWVISVVAGFLIFATLSMMVTEKTKDIGILAAMGATRRGILLIFLICGAIIGLLGCVFGLLTGWYSAIHLNDFNNWTRENFGVELFSPKIYKLREVPYELDPVWMGQVALIAFALALVFSFIPAWRASRLDPVEALRYE